jgi:hypothetical protein
MDHRRATERGPGGGGDGDGRSAAGSPADAIVPPEETLAGYARWAASYDAMDNPLVAATGWVLDRA